MPEYMGAAKFKIAQRQQAMGEMDRIIQQYKLDAENERRVAGGALATLGAEMENNPDGVNSLAQSNPEFGKALKLLNEGKAKKKDMQIISASLAANTQARAQKLDSVNKHLSIALDQSKLRVAQATEVSRVQQENMKMMSAEIAVEVAELERLHAKEDRPEEKALLENKLKTAQAELDRLRRANLLDKETYEAKKREALARAEESEARATVAGRQADWLGEFKDWEAAAKIVKQLKGLGMDAKVVRDDQGRISISTLGAEDEGKSPVPIEGFENYFTHGGSIYRTDKESGTITKVTSEDINADAKDARAALKALTSDPQLMHYLVISSGKGEPRGQEGWEYVDGAGEDQFLRRDPDLDDLIIKLNELRRKSAGVN